MDPVADLDIHSKKGVRKMRNNWTNGVMGVLIGDALGNPVQFMSRSEVVRRGLVKGMEAGGVFHMPAGCWTDDGSMTLASLDSILTMGRIDPDDMMKRFIMWDSEGQYTPTGRAYDQGITCMEALDAYRRGKKWDSCGRTGEYANGNGALMRILPVCLYSAYMQEKFGISDLDAVLAVHHATLITHNHLRACTASGMYYFMCREILRSRGGFDGTGSAGAGGSLAEILLRGIDAGVAFYRDNDMDDEIAHFTRIRDLKKLAATDAGKIKSSGYVIHTIEAAVWSLVTTNSFSEALLKAVNLGDDADTVGAVAGGLAGLYYGYDNVPEDWKSAMKKRDELEEICRKADGFEFKKA